MRKVEQEINKIINDFQKRAVTGACQRTKRDRIESQNGSVYTYLWNHNIAQITDDKIILYARCWRTVTTKSRLNAVLRLTGRPLYVYQKNFKWFVYDSELDETTPFYEGISFQRFN